MTTNKKLEGFVDELNPTTIMVCGKTIYLPQDKRGYVSEQNLSVADAVRITYTPKGDIVTIDRLSKEDKAKLGKLPTVAKIIDAEAEQKKNMHINNPTTVAPPATGVYIQPEESKKESTPTGMDSNKAVHIQKPEVTWITEREKNNTIILESLLARSVEIVNANYVAFDNIGKSPSEFMEVLDARCVLVERITDRLFEYVKKKVKDEQIHDNL
jgi:hypothetical protein